MYGLHCQEITGKVLREISGEKYFIKFMNKNMCHNGMKYVVGCNHDKMAFNPNGYNNGGGIYFVNLFHCFDYLFLSEYASIIEIPDDARVFIEDDKMKTNKIIIHKPKKFLLCINELIDDDNVSRDTIMKILEQKTQYKKYINPIHLSHDVLNGNIINYYVEMLNGDKHKKCNMMNNFMVMIKKFITKRDTLCQH
jgi:hypothetical protein